MNNYICILFWLLPVLTKAIEPITIGTAIATSAVSYFGYDVIKDMTYCRFKECCNKRSIPVEINKLKWRMEKDLFGQHIIVEQLMGALRSHFSEKRKSRKPLVLSFHGTPGTGKNYVSDMIAESMYSLGLQSSYVHKFMGRTDFSSSQLVNYYKEKVLNAVKEGLSACPLSLFIFDEVEKMPAGIFEFLTNMLDFNSYLYGVDNSQAVFIFISNTAGVQISDHLGDLIKSGKLREETRLSDFERILEKTAYITEGGFKESSLIKAHVIDHFMPFLPLEKSHVYNCVKAEFKMWNIDADDNKIESIVQDIISYERTHGIFAISGCKRVHKKVGLSGDT